MIFDLTFGRWRGQILHAGVALGVFDSLADGPTDARTLASSLGLDAPLLYRLLRALASIGVLTESSDHSFALTAAGELLRRDHPQTLRGTGSLRALEAPAGHGA
jgi:Dimerisation domain